MVMNRAGASRPRSGCCQRRSASNPVSRPSDNLMIVQGRIGTLDVYALAAMVWAGAAYLRGRSLTAGALIAVGACMKLVSGYLLLAFALIEVLRRLHPQRYGAPSPRRWAVCALGAAAVFLGLLTILDAIARPYDDTAHSLIAANPFAHLGAIQDKNAARRDFRACQGFR